MSNDRLLSLSTVSATIYAPIEKVNIADWLFHLPDAEYQRCSQAHIAAGTTTSDDGRPMSINVETIGDAFVVQHYVGRNSRAAFLPYGFYLRFHFSRRTYQAPGYMGTQRTKDRRPDL